MGSLITAREVGGSGKAMGRVVDAPMLAWLDAWRARYEKAVEENLESIKPLTRAEFEVLLALRTHQPGPPWQAELAWITGYSTTTVQRALIAIKRHGLLPE